MKRFQTILLQPGELKHVGFDVPTTIHMFTCRWCGQPGQDTNANTRTHPGECRELDKQRRMRATRARAKQKQ